MEHIEWHSETRKVSELKEYPNNPRKATKEEAEQLRRSIEKFSVADPLVINCDNEVIGGNFRLSILKQQKIKEVDVRVPDRLLSRDEANELNIRLNKNSGEFDYAELANFDMDMLKDVGFSDKEMEDFFPEQIERLEPDIKIEETYEVIVECKEEEEQKQIFDKLTKEGLVCRILIY